MKSKMIALVACMLTSFAFADEAPKNPCEKPIQPNRQSSDVIVKAFNKHLTAYTACIKKFVDDEREIAKTSTDQVRAKQANDAAEAAIVEYNALMDAVKAASAKQDDD